jgi:hypothetical protein
MPGQKEKSGGSRSGAGGNLEAIKLLMGYTFGKPKERHEHSGPDRSPIPISLTGALDKFYGDDGAESD